MLATMTMSSVGIVPPLSSVRTAVGQDPSEERRRARRERMRHAAGHFVAEAHGERRAPALRRPRYAHDGRQTH